MKKSLIALAVAALAASSVSATTVYDKDGTALSVYGRVQSVFYSNDVSGVTYDDGPVEHNSASISTSARLGVDLRTQINSNVAAFGVAEWEAANGDNVADEENGFKARYLWVGLDFGQYGQVKAGKFEEAIKYVISPTDIFDDWGCTGLAGCDDKREGVVQYQWSGAGFDAIASYAFAKDNEHLDGAYFTGAKFNGPELSLNRENADLDYSWSLAVGYTSPDVVFGPIAVRAGYLAGEFADAKYNGNNVGGLVAGSAIGAGLYDSYDQWAVSASWGKLDVGPYVAAAYQIRSFDVNPIADGFDSYDYDVSGWEFVVGYSFANGVSVRTGYLTQNVDIDNSTVDVDAATVPVYVNWQLNPQVNVWAEARFDAGTDDSNTNSEDNFADIVGQAYAENVFSAGMRYTF